MGNLDDALIAHYDVDGVRFEVYVDKDKSYDFKFGAKSDFGGVLIADDIYKDAKKGDKHTNDMLSKAFGMVDPRNIAEIIVRKGELPITTVQRRKLMDEKVNKIKHIILRESIDPRTNAPHTIVRLNNAFEQVRVNIDPFKSAEEQVESVVVTLRPVLPIKFEKVRIAIKIPAEYAQRVYGNIKEFGLKKEQWTSTGALVAIIEIPGGMQPEVYSKLNSLTHGEVETKLMEK